MGKKYKEYVKKIGIEIDEDASLRHTHKQLKERINNEVYEQIMNVILVRNHFEHEFLYDIFEKYHGELRIANFDAIKEVMDLCYNIFCDSIDYVQNLMDKLDLSDTYHPERRTNFSK